MALLSHRGAGTPDLLFYHAMFDLQRRVRR